MGVNTSGQQKQKFQFVDINDAQQFQFRPINHKTSLETHKQIHPSLQNQGPINGYVGQYTGLSQFVVPQKYLEIMRQNPLQCDKPNIQGTSGIDPFMFKKSLNVYFGEWKNGKPHGYGKIFNPDRDFYYEGYFEGGLPSYYGVFLTEGINYTGQLKLSRAEGNGVYKQKETIIEGEFKQNYPSKNCTEKGLNYQFKGEFQGGKWKKGILLWNQGKCLYEGDFLNGLIHGKGVLKTVEYIYQGDFKHGMKNGVGDIVWKTGQCYRGQFQDDEITGNGEFLKQNKLIYKGYFSKGKAKGQGCTLQSEKLIYAHWINGQINQIS